jgi:hypothetical protein
MSGVLPVVLRDAFRGTYESCSMQFKCECHVIAFAQMYEDLFAVDSQ